MKCQPCMCLFNSHHHVGTAANQVSSSGQCTQQLRVCKLSHLQWLPAHMRVCLHHVAEHVAAAAAAVVVVVVVGFGWVV